MSNQDWLEYKIQIRERLKTFTINILKVSAVLPANTRGKVINYQVTKSGSSMYANYRAALRSRSKAEFFSKLSIAVEESDETEMWLDLIFSSGLITTNFIKEIHNESLELLKILASMRSRANGKNSI